MSNLLVRLFIKDYQNTQDARVRERYGKLSGIVGIITNLLLFVIKVSVGLFFGSIAVVADAINNLSDSASSVVTLVGFKVSGKPADRKHPYGHARMEYLSGLAVSFVILLVGFQLLQSSFDKIFHPEAAVFSWVTLGALAVSILIKVWQGLFYRKMGKAIDSPTLSAASADSLSDVFSTGAVLIGLLLSQLIHFNLDGYLGVLVAVLIIVTGVKVIISTSDPLLGTVPSKELVDKIYKKIHSYKGIVGIHDLNIHSYGAGRCFASVHCEVPADVDILVSHDIIDNIERDFLKQDGIHMVIHMDPIVMDDEKTNRLRDQVEGIITSISEEITMHDFRVVWGKSHSNLIFDICVPYEFRYTDKEICDLLEKKLQELNPTYFGVITVDHLYGS